MANGDDHATRRDGAAATRRDGGGATRRDNPGSTARDNGHAGATSRDVAGSGREYGIVLPGHLARDYIVVDDLSTGGEATVAVVQHRETGAIKVVKIYRQGITLPQSMIDKLKNADVRHVLRVERSLYTGWATPRFIEVMDYVPAGSLAARLDRSAGGLPNLARQILTEMTDALEYIHDGLNLVHRDIKPANVLIREDDPLDLVLADLGIASELDEIARSRRETTGSVKGTPAYQSPETLNSSDAGRARDWWALGMTMCEVLTGQHPFKDSAGNELRDEGRIRQAITMGDIDLSIISDARWNLLCRGLLSHHPDDRWGSRQVRAWLAGESPAVVSRQQVQPPGTIRREFHVRGTCVHRSSGSLHSYGGQLGQGHRAVHSIIGMRGVAHVDPGGPAGQPYCHQSVVDREYQRRPCRCARHRFHHALPGAWWCRTARGQGHCR